jgi:hypothetical protein
LVLIAKMLNSYVKSIGKINNTVGEPSVNYQKVIDKNVYNVWSDDLTFIDK